jgi:energy-coupling factor transport system ATP-binding protein
VNATAQPVELCEVRIRHENREQFSPDGVTLTVRRGEVLLVLGPSGCGKSTLTLALNGLVPHEVPADVEGEIGVTGLDPREHRVARLSPHVAMVFQDPDAQLVTMSVLDEVCFAPENLLVPKPEVLERAERALRSVGLWDRRHDNPDTLSGGGKQRLAIACALAQGGDVLVLDEPTANLDPSGIADVYEALASVIRANPRLAVVLVEHNLDQAMPFVTHVAVLDATGHLTHTGTVDLLRAEADELAKSGVWLPVATLAALRLRRAGVVLAPLPLTARELAAALDGAELPALPVLSAPPTSPTWPDGEQTTAEPRNASLIEVRGLNVRRGRSTVLRGIDLDIARGDFLALIGVNGAGKTTLAQAIAGLLPPAAGSVRIGGFDVTGRRVAEVADRVGFVFQNPEHQFVTNRVFDELAYGLRARGVTEPNVIERVDDMLHRFGLDELRDEHPFLLSGGQKRRLSVGTALICGADVLVLDEPTFGQDRARALELLELLTQLHRSGTTVVIVTHDLQLVAEHASHVAVLFEGRVVRFGSASDVLDEEAALRAAGLRLPPLAAAMRTLTRDDGWRRITRLADVPAAPAGAAL